LGDSGPEQSVDTLNLSSHAITVDTANVDSAVIVYDDALVGLKITITYTLAGNDLNENIQIVNNTSEELHFFQYSDFDLAGTAGGDFGQFVSTQTVRQVDPLLAGLTETVISPQPQHRELNFFPTTLNKLNDGDADTLSDSPPIGAFIGPGDLTWAFQWDTGPGGDLVIIKDKHLDPTGNIPELAPEPTALAIWGLGLGIVGVAGWRRRNRK
jgi:hypothetical protein